MQPIVAIDLVIGATFLRNLGVDRATSATFCVLVTTRERSVDSTQLSTQISPEMAKGGHASLACVFGSLGAA